MKSLLHVRSLLFDTPLAILPSKIDAILGAIGGRIGIEVDAELIEAARGSIRSDQKSFAITPEGVAVIPITGTLMAKTSGLDAVSGCTSYETIQSQVEDAFTSPQVKGILLTIDSGGGSTSNLFDLCDLIYSMRSEKPIVAAVDNAFSAAFALASCASQIFITRVGGAGSIGVVALHCDQSEADKAEGLSYKYVYAGDRKIDGNPHSPLSEQAEATLQKEIDRQYGLFVSTVARNRKMTSKSVEGTQAGVFYADNAIKAGLVDHIGTFAEALTAITTIINTSELKTTILKMSGQIEETKPMAQIELTTAEQEVLILAKSADEQVAAAAPEPTDDNDEDDEKEKEAKAKAKAKAKKEAEDACDTKSARADAVRIVNLCTLAGMPSLASEFLAANYSIADAEKALLKHRATKSKEVQISSTSAKQSDFRTVAATMYADKTKTNKAEEYRKYLVEHADEYMHAMQNRTNGQNYMTRGN